MEEKIWVKELLDDVRKDAIRKSQGKKVTEQVYSAIIQLLKLTKVAYKEGLVALEEEMRDDLENGTLEPELNNIAILPMGIEYIVDGTEDDVLAEMLTTKYWVNNPQGMEALVYYIFIRGMVMIRENLSVYYMETLLTALLPEGCIAEFERRKENRIPEQASKTQMEKLLEKEWDLPRKSIIIRNVLEEKMDQVAESVVKAGLQKLDRDDDRWSAFVLRGLSGTGKKKVLFCMSPVRRNAVLEIEAYMGPIRVIDIEDALVKFLECLEKTENEAGQS